MSHLNITLSFPIALYCNLIFNACFMFTPMSRICNRSKIPLFPDSEKELMPGGSIWEQSVQAHTLSRALSLNDSDVLPGVGVCECGSSQVEPRLPALAEPTGKVRRHQSWPTRLLPRWPSPSAAWRNTDYGNAESRASCCCAPCSLWVQCGKTDSTHLLFKWESL